jgi:hypothetical protein
MKSLIYLFLFYVSLCQVLVAQTQLIFSNNPFLVIENGGKLVIENGATNAIALQGSGGNIITTSENDQLIWNIDINSGVYTVPFTTVSIVNGGTETKIPSTVNITSAGTGSGRFIFSTYGTSDMNTPWPSSVTHMNNASGMDNSLMVIDRFWIIEPENYVTNPSAMLTLNYDPSASEIGGLNLVTEANLVAQRFNTTANQWGDYTGGTVNIAQSRIENIVVVATDFFGTWTIADRTSPLPIELAHFSGVCNVDEVLLNWVTQSEINNDYFTVEQSLDGENWNQLATLEGAGNSTQPNYYQHSVSNSGLSTVFYRLKQTDFDGTYTFSNPISVSCDDTHFILVYPNPTTNMLNIKLSEEFIGKPYSIMNSIGQVIWTDKVSNTQFSINLTDLPSGIYCFQLATESGVLVKKVVKN